MGESCDVHSEEDEVLPEKNKKRRLKTSSQVEALEKFYNEHKYPTEAMKSQLAEEIGLSEKQISGWFCHRRLKDKKLKDEACASGRQDVSSAVIQDRGSGLRQDSCSSTKQGDYSHFDPREVESRRLYGQDYPAADITYKNRGQYMCPGNYNAIDSTSSGSSSASQDRLFPQSEDPYDLDPLRYSSRDSNYMLNTGGVKDRGYKMVSGYLNLQDDVENDAITAVKRQLGRHYREDGPPLGVEFQPLPPGAFDSLIKNPIHEPYYVGDPFLQNSQRVCNEPGLGTRYEKFDSKMHSQGSYLEGEHIRRTTWESDRRDNFSSFSLKQKSSLTNYSNHAPDWKSAIYLGDDSAREASVLSNRNYGVGPKHGIKGLILDSVTDNRHHPYVGKIIRSESSSPRLHNCDDAFPHVFQTRDYLDSKPSNFTLQHNESIDTEGRGKSRRMQGRKLYGQRRTSKELGSSVQIKRQPKNETKMGRRIRGDEFLPWDNLSKTPSPQELLPWTNQIRRSAAEMPTSFSEDETAATISSMD